MEDRVYVIVLRNLDLPDRKFCMTSGRIAGHGEHAVALLQFTLDTIYVGKDAKFVGENPPIKIWDLNIINLSVAGSADMALLCDQLKAEGTKFVEYRDIDRAFGPGEFLTAIACYPMEKDSSPVLKKLKPWRCACNEVK